MKVFVDIKRQALFKYKKDTIELIHRFNESIGFAYPHYKKPDILICGMKSGIYSFDINKKNLDVVIDVNRDGYRINDGYIDHNNIIWFGTMCDDDSKISNSTKLLTTLIKMVLFLKIELFYSKWTNCQMIINGYFIQIQ